MLLRELFLVFNLVVAVKAWATSSRASAFSGSVLTPLWVDSPASASAYPGGRRMADLTMKKGKPNVPPQMRGQYKKMQEMAQMRDQYLAMSTPGEDGMAVFNLFVRTKKANLWYPCGSFKGDSRSSALAKSYADNGLLAGISKKQLDNGVAGSLFRDQEKLKESLIRAYPQLKQSRDDLQFGYKLALKGLSEEKASEINMVEPKESKGVIDNLKSLFS